jgi:uncharacterized protein
MHRLAPTRLRSLAAPAAHSAPSPNPGNLPSVNLAKADARRALVRHHFQTLPSIGDVFQKFRSIQFDPIAPIGCNHDLVLQARLPDYQIGDWETFAYTHRAIYDGWDKQASLVPMEGWPARRLIHKLHRRSFEEKIFQGYPEAVQSVLDQIRKEGPLMPKELEFQARRDDWQGSWLGPSVAKQVLRALWHVGEIVTSRRQKGQHVYDLAERVIPTDHFQTAQMSDEEARQIIAVDRHLAMGIVRPNADAAIWSYSVLLYDKKPALQALLERGEIVKVEVEGMKLHAPPTFLQSLDQPPLEKAVTFVAPLDPFLWDRKMTAHLFGFDYAWEIYTPLPKRRWGYYVLPIRYGDDLAARIEFYARDGVIEIREWHEEPGKLDPEFGEHLAQALSKLKNYARAEKIELADRVKKPLRKILPRIR